MRRARLSLLLVLALSPLVWADRLAVPHVPQRYVVQSGDTLWGIADHFFQDPWRWPGIWNRNLQIRDPDLIYPGDVIVLRYVHGTPYLVNEGPARALTGQTQNTVVLRPTVGSRALVGAIPTLDPNVIGPFLQRPLALSRRAFRRLGYVAGAVHRHTFMSPLSRFYARHLGAHPDKTYEIYRRGPALRTSDGDFLAYETKYVGQAKLVRPGRLPELEVVSSIRQVEAGDRLVPWRRAAPIPYYYPRAPRKRIRAVVVAATHNDLNLGTYAAVAINAGKNAGIRRGYVLRIFSRPRSFYDPVAHEMVRGRKQPLGLLMIFRTFSRVSYGIIMQARREIHVGDSVTTPQD
ncbi:LysM peptidoglycan-binding domain-containing protein [Acidiferrobacter sp.]|uniref:LysM peptidoglycan-binding domain-containing protein n=1 Tax=Acidiferrobacter sp. TaxID=1872107 RepID=UPI0026176A8A|nr:LysM peptidoglycan-binding domain-containing protein [Acidiferrobacter sp.]